MGNYYNNLAKMPALKARKMPKGLEELAQTLVHSGRLRIDTVIEQNFARWGRPEEGVNMMFSHRELFDKNLIPQTVKIINTVLSRNYSGKQLQNKTSSELERLQDDEKKNIAISADTEIKLARLVVQSAEPPVIMLLLAEKAEIFVSYSYNVGDMLDIQTWQEAGDSSGLQSTDSRNCAVFVSCGGNPLITKKNPDRPTDGFNALSRMVVIAGQELAHYSDIIREGRKRGNRFSADLYRGRASKICKKGRLDDMDNVRLIWQKINNIGLKRVSEAERSLEFFKKYRKWSLTILISRIKVYIYQTIFILLCKKNKLDILRPFYKEEYMCSKINIMLADMLFNLEPDADAYKRPNPVEEEMIMCIEALARVQQQSNKWGRELTIAMYPNLSDLYYKTILPSCVKSVERITGNLFPVIFSEWSQKQ